ncbi:hypothetical protein ACHAQE_000707 [Botrytis cinerea]
MKLIVAGSTGFVATELIKQALSSPDVTSVIALARRETPVPQTLDDNADITKFKAVICDDFLNYLDNVKKELEGADACGEAETRVIDYAKASNGTVEACIAKPGLIDGPDRRQGLVVSVLSTIGRRLIGLPIVDVSQIAATLLEHAVNGIEKETLLNEDLVRIGDRVLSG